MNNTFPSQAQIRAKEFMEIMTGDMVTINEAMKRDGYTPILKRLGVRTALATCEGVLWCAKSVILDAADLFVPSLTETEKAFLRDVTFSIKENGVIKEDVAKIGLKANILFTTKILGRLGDIDFPIRTTDEGWILLTNAIKVRDRLMHPKNINDLDISDEEYNGVLNGTTWLYQKLCELIEVHNDLA